MNKYAIITIEQLDEFYPHYIGEKEEQRLSLDKTKAVIKFPVENQNPIFEGLEIYEHSEILEIMSSADWTSTDL